MHPLTPKLQTYPRAEKYLRYNELKTILNDIVSEKIKAVSTTIVAPPTPTTAAKLVPSHAEYDSYNQFVTLLDANIESIERFYEEKVKLFGVEIEFYRMKLEVGILFLLNVS